MYTTTQGQINNMMNYKAETSQCEHESIYKYYLGVCVQSLSHV